MIIKKKTMDQIILYLSIVSCVMRTIDTTNVDVFRIEPPKLLPKQSSDENKRIVKSGHSVSLECPIEKSKNDEFYFEWYKNGDPIENFDQRIRITESGALKMKNSMPEDTGHYVCKAINGFGSVQFSITLIVLDEDYDDITSSKDQIKIISQLETSPQNNPVQFEGRPQLTHYSEFEEQVIVKKTGSSITFKCEVTGNPKPSITWFHNSEQFSDSEPRKGRNSLVVSNLKPEDSGNYTCLSTNLYGTVSHSYVLKVIDYFINKPQMSDNEPSNTSVAVGQTASFHCSITSEELPHIQWLKRIQLNTDYLEGMANNELTTEGLHYIKLMGELYKTLDTTQTIQTSDTIFSNNLFIYNVNELDAGGYMCLAVNSKGSIFKSAYLSVLTSQQKQRNLNEMAKQEFLPLPIVVALGSVVLIIVVAVIVWLSMCLSQPNPQTIQSLDSGSKYAVCLPSNSTYNQIMTNKCLNTETHPSSYPIRAQGASSPFYSELITNDRRISNVYQMHSNPKVLQSLPKSNHFQSNKPYGHFC